MYSRMERVRVAITDSLQDELMHHHFKDLWLVLRFPQVSNFRWIYPASPGPLCGIIGASKEDQEHKR